MISNYQYWRSGHGSFYSSIDGFHLEHDFRKVHCLETSYQVFDFNSKWFPVVTKIDGVKKKVKSSGQNKVIHCDNINYESLILRSQANDSRH